MGKAVFLFLLDALVGIREERTCIHAGEAVPLLRLGRLIAEPVADHCVCPYVVACSTESGAVGLPADKLLHVVDWLKSRREDGRYTVGDNARAVLLFMTKFAIPWWMSGASLQNYLSGVFGTRPHRGTRRFE